jgi:hypothetical protein
MLVVPASVIRRVLFFRLTTGRGYYTLGSVGLRRLTFPVAYTAYILAYNKVQIVDC